MNKNFETQSRFRKIFVEDACLLPSYDRALQSFDGCVVVPTLGSILPNWLLVVPEDPALNFREWEGRHGLSASSLVEKFLVSREIEAGRAIWFEHGPSRVGTAVGCGLDHAHLHILVDAPFSADEFIAAAEDASRREFLNYEAGELFQALPDTSYLLISSRSRSSVATDVDHIGSQFLRRIIASLVGEPDGWNYRTHPWLSNVEKTLQTFPAA